MHEVKSMSGKWGHTVKMYAKISEIHTTVVYWNNDGQSQCSIIDSLAVNSDSVVLAIVISTGLRSSTCNRVYGGERVDSCV